MRLLIASYGTEGDVRPLAALAQRWMQAGNDVHLLADQATLGHARESGIACAPLSGDIRGLAGASGSIAGVVASRQRRRSVATALAEIANHNADAWLGEILEAGQNADGILASGLAVFSALSAGERLRVPVMGASFIPISPTRAFASPFLPPAHWPAFLNLASHRFINEMIWRSMRGACNEARRRVGLPPRDKLWTTHPILYGISPVLLPRPVDWPAHVHLCGQWTPPSAEWFAPPALAAFLRSGPPPVYIGFGSMIGFDAEAVWREVLAALDGRRALVAPGWAGVAGVEMPENVYVLGEVPHDALFPHVSAVVHHGGSGTSHSAIRAGRPSVVVAFAGDQAFWGSRLSALGVAAPPLSGHRLRAAALARAIAYTERDDVRARARKLGVRSRAEDGAANAMAALHRLLAPCRTAVT